MYAQNSEMDGDGITWFEFLLKGLWFVAERVYGNLVKAWNDPPCCCCLVFLGLFGIVALFFLVFGDN